MLSFITETRTVWDRLRETKKPIALYGMGLGAEKILAQFKQFGIHAAEIFASDEFVRGHSFLGYKVKKLSALQEQYDDLFIVVSFAFWQQEIIQRIAALAERYELVAPHVPVVGGGIVDFQTIARDEESIAGAYELMADGQSKRVYAAVMNYKLSGKISYILDVTTPKHEVYTHLLTPGDAETFVDLGAYDGDTVLEFLEYAGGCRRIVAVEPDEKNFRKLTATMEKLPFLDVVLYNTGIWENDATLLFDAKAGRHSALTQENGKQSVPVPMRKVDSLSEARSATFLKMDVEGAEKEALLGSAELIAAQKPKLIVSAYHRNEDTYTLPLLIHKLNPNYKIFMRQHPYIPAWENNIYAR